MRISSAALLLALAGCGTGEGVPPPDPDSLIDCALDGADEFVRACAVERASVDGALELTVFDPDGGFRRFAVTDDGSGLKVADGADSATTTVVDNMLEVEVAGDRYRFPATVESDDQPG